MAQILTITLNPALDLSSEAPAVLPDRKLRCTEPRVQPGGGGVNVSRAISNLGGASRTLLAQGGFTGQVLVAKLVKEGLIPVSLGVDHPTRHSFSVRDASNGQQYRFMLPGPSWTEEDSAGARNTILAALAPGDLVVPSGSMPPGVADDFFLDLNKAVAAGGGRMILDTSGPTLARAASAGAGIFTLRMDLAEASGLSGRALVRIEDVAAFAREARAGGAAEIVMVGTEAHGTVIASAEWCGITRPPVVVPVSRIGAGDSFVGAYALALARGESPVIACARGTAAAASAVTAPGTDLCRLDETETFFRAVVRQPL